MTDRTINPEASEAPILDWFCSGYFDEPSCCYTMTEVYVGGGFIGPHQCPRCRKPMYQGQLKES